MTTLICLLGGIVIILLITVFKLYKSYSMTKEHGRRLEQKLNAKVEDYIAIHRKDIIATIKTLETQKITTTEAIKAYESQLAQLKNSQKEILNEHYDKTRASISAKIDNYIIEETDEFNKTFSILISKLETEKNSKIEELNKITEELDDFKKRRDTVNEEILRQKKIEEDEKFYKINLDSGTLHDLNLLESIKPKLLKIDLIQKLEYNSYIDKPTKEMIKRVLNGQAPSGVYKITRLKTGEIYVGQATDIKKRWTEHAKSCFGCGTISYSTLHRTMAEDGIQNFTWELLEEVPKDKLREREKFWIKFYDSKNYGLNEKVG